MNPGSSVIDPTSYVTAPAAGATRSIFDPRTVTTTFRCTARPSKICAARIVTGAAACCAGRLVAPATKISNQVRRRLVIGFTMLRMISEIARHFRVEYSLDAASRLAFMTEFSAVDTLPESERRCQGNQTARGI